MGKSLDQMQFKHVFNIFLWETDKHVQAYLQKFSKIFVNFGQNDVKTSYFRGDQREANLGDNYVGGRQGSLITDSDIHLMLRPLFTIREQNLLLS